MERQALEILECHRVDLVITDLKMPVMNGYQVVDYVNKSFPCLPVYVMTGDYLPDVKPRFRSAVVSQFVSKPFSFRQVAADIMRTASRSSSLRPYKQHHNSARRSSFLRPSAVF